MFNWQYYLNKYPDLRQIGIHTEQQAIQHWNLHGEKEGRIPSQLLECYNINTIDKNKINSTCKSGGRLGNMFIRNMVSSIIAYKNRLLFVYDRLEEFKQLGIDSLLFTGTNTYDDTLLITDNIINEVLFNDTFFNKYVKDKNILFKIHDYNPFNIYDHTWAQTKEIALHIKNTIYDNRDKIIEKNPYKERYNNDVFVHVRLGDIVELNLYTSYEYYDKALSQITFDKGYISSDTISHEICTTLINKYNLIVYNNTEIDTIQFASTCKNIVLSTGTFSWMIGIFGFFSNIYYPETKVIWHGDIFIYPEWTMINY